MPSSGQCQPSAGTPVPSAGPAGRSAVPLSSAGCTVCIVGRGPRAYRTDRDPCGPIRYSDRSTTGYMPMCRTCAPWLRIFRDPRGPIRCSEHPQVRTRLLAEAQGLTLLTVIREA